MPADRVIQFRERQMPKSACAKSTLPNEVALSLERSMEKLPRLAQSNPDAALLIERNIDDWMLPPSSPEDGGTRRDRLPWGQARAHLKIAEVRAVITVVSAQAALVDRVRQLK
jgi:hypothetical protein